MTKARSIISASCTALALAFFSLGCATSSSGTQHAKLHAASCASCSVTVVDQVPLPVSDDLAVARLDQRWTIVEHNCSCCEDQNTRFFAGADFQDPCEMDATSGLCCADQSGSAVSGLVQVTQ
jgi:hypothetical protein